MNDATERFRELQTEVEAGPGWVLLADVLGRLVDHVPYDECDRYRELVS